MPTGRCVGYPDLPRHLSSIYGPATAAKSFERSQNLLPRPQAEHVGTRKPKM